MPFLYQTLFYIWRRDAVCERCEGAVILTGRMAQVCVQREHSDPIALREEACLDVCKLILLIAKL